MHSIVLGLGLSLLESMGLWVVIFTSASQLWVLVLFCSIFALDEIKMLDLSVMRHFPSLALVRL